ncbi:MAG: aminoacetone oxidase family FAD-binding enzyme [Prevotellaceae bacterium]|nr:aminoacetone oxidase family FAD-binding enzyme [Prevotellaceae bacterium]
MRVAIIGGGAAGCFAAISVKRRCPEAEVTVYESDEKLLSKVAVTGGGRCNLTNSFAKVKSIESVYPRGARLMKRLLMQFSHEDTFRWFESEGVRLVVQEDCCVFPKSQNAMEIVDTLVSLMRGLGVCVKTGHRLRRLVRADEGNGSVGSEGNFKLVFSENGDYCRHADKVLVAMGGIPKLKGFSFLDGIGLEIVSPVPSLFGLCLPNQAITEMTGTVVNDVSVSIRGTKLRAEGPLLITHWGMSGPAILRLSSYGARFLAESEYKADIAVNWFGESSESEVAEQLARLSSANLQKQLSSVYPNRFNSRLWQHLLQRCGLRPEQRWAELGSKSRNKMVATMTNDIYHVDGKNRFKEEFVTCGGVSLRSVSQSTLEAKACPGLYFAGEVLDVDAVTGGFNLQAAWTMGEVAASNLVDSL